MRKVPSSSLHPAAGRHKIVTFFKSLVFLHKSHNNYFHTASILSPEAFSHIFISQIPSSYGSWDRVVSTVIRLRTGRFDFRILGRKMIVPFPETSRMAMGPTHLPVKLVTKFFRGDKVDREFTFNLLSWYQTFNCCMQNSSLLRPVLCLLSLIHILLLCFCHPCFIQTFILPCTVPCHKCSHPSKFARQHSVHNYFSYPHPYYIHHLSYSLSYVCIIL